VNIAASPDALLMPIAYNKALSEGYFSVVSCIDKNPGLGDFLSGAAFRPGYAK
jgi:hypothetical protein